MFSKIYARGNVIAWGGLKMWTRINDNAHPYPRTICLNFFDKIKNFFTVPSSTDFSFVLFSSWADTVKHFTPVYDNKFRFDYRYYF